MAPSLVWAPLRRVRLQLFVFQAKCSLFLLLSFGVLIVGQARLASWPLLRDAQRQPNYFRSDHFKATLELSQSLVFGAVETGPLVVVGCGAAAVAGAQTFR